MSTQTLLSIRVQSRAKETCCTGWKDSVLQIRVNAPPVDDAANQAVVKLLSTLLDVPKSRIRIERGAHGRNKMVAVEGLSLEEIRKRLETTET